MTARLTFATAALASVVHLRRRALVALQGLLGAEPADSPSSVVTPPVLGGRAATTSTPPASPVNVNALRREIVEAANDRMTVLQLVGLARAVAGREIGAIDLDRAWITLRDELDGLDADGLVELLHRVEVPA